MFYHFVKRTHQTHPLRLYKFIWRRWRIVNGLLILKRWGGAAAAGEIVLSGNLQEIKLYWIAHPFRKGGKVIARIVRGSCEFLLAYVWKGGRMNKNNIIFF